MVFRHDMEFGIIITLERNQVIPGSPVYQLICQVTEISRSILPVGRCYAELSEFLKARGTQSF